MHDSAMIPLYEWIDETTVKLSDLLNETYLDSLGLTLEALFYGGLDEQTPPHLQEHVLHALKEVNVEEYDETSIGKAIQFAILKGMKKSTQPQHSMTPEAISLFIGYLAEKLMKDKNNIRLFDPASGTGNLLLLVMGHLTQNIQAYASEVDPTLIKLALFHANLQKRQVEFFHQDSLQPFLLDPVDLVVCDLPVGYYPDDVRANEFELKAKEGHSYAHHLFIEQSLTYTKEDGYLIFLIPDNLFESDQAEQLHEFIQKHAQIIGVLQLPETAFKGQENKKSILILQKVGENTPEINQPLLALLPSFNNTDAMEDIIVKINQWFDEANIN